MNLDVFHFGVPPDVRDNIIWKRCVPSDIGHETGQTVAPNPTLAGGSFTHCRIAQVHSQIAARQGGGQLISRNEAIYRDKVSQLEVLDHLPDRVFVFQRAIDIDPEPMPLRKRTQSLEKVIESPIRSQETKHNDAICLFVRPRVAPPACMERLSAIR